MPFPFPAGAVRLAAAGACALALTALPGCSDGGGGGGDGATEPASRSPASAGTQVTIKDFTFQPASLTVSPGAKVTVGNKDSTTHTLTASKGGSFDTGDIAPGRSATFTAPSTAGDFPYTCTIHPFMKGTLTVE
ncbi:cupredoxin family copper-binding protein [Streptomyces ardesiacus]|uniref:cupredoxin domain-containing protein n=1 Tax=Streptomyces TaxID=1883 RepID=UPI0004BEF9E6|nr:MULTISPECIES: cupredoxin family copper-binding protein [unclassified Streptomyces]KOU10784.1 metal-binding protein [Streptomyces sp. NRRL F-4711]KOX30615.1 metal-binding protein [Streptomyces sp. NRRL F-4707]